MNEKKIGRVNEEIRRIVSNILRNGIKDPRIYDMVSITNVKTSNDLRYTNIYFSVYGEKPVQESTLEGLNSAKSFIRREIGNKLDLRIVPEPIFHLDTSMEDAMAMSKLIDSVLHGEENEK